MATNVNLEIILREYLVDSLRGRASVSGHSARARFPKSGCLRPRMVSKSRFSLGLIAKILP